MSAKKIVFEQSIKVNGVKYTAGTVVEESKIPAGHLESMRRQGQVSDYVEHDAASEFAASMLAGLPDPKPGDLVVSPDGFDVIPTGPTVEDAKKMVAEINRQRALLDGHRTRAAAADEVIADLKKQNGELAEQLAAANAKLEADKKPTDGDPPPEAPKPDAAPPAEAKAKPPVIGPSKPPELKAGGKK